MVYTIEQIKNRIEPVAAKYGLPAVYLFGSYAKGEADENSDVDILVDKTGTSLTGMLAMGGLYNELADAIGKPIDLVTTGALEQESTVERTPWFVENLSNERVKIYGAEKSDIWETATKDIPNLLRFCDEHINNS